MIRSSVGDNDSLICSVFFSEFWLMYLYLLPGCRWQHSAVFDRKSYFFQLKSLCIHSCSQEHFPRLSQFFFPIFILFLSNNLFLSCNIYTSLPTISIFYKPHFHCTERSKWCPKSMTQSSQLWYYFIFGCPPYAEQRDIFCQLLPPNF